MASALPATPLALAALVLGVLGALLLIAALVALVRLRLLRFSIRLLASVALLALGGLFGAIALGMQGYRALTREDLAARLVVRPTGPQRFSAIVTLADGRQAAYDVAGDEIYVDAHILKWKPIANIVGVHTAYELGRAHV